MNERRDWAPVDWSPMKRLIYLRGNGAAGGGGSPLTVTGATPLLMPGAVSKPLRAATFAIEAVQSGSGDPSPSNVRPITGWTGCTAWVTGKNLWPIAEITASGYYNKLSEQTYPEIWSMARALIPGQKYRIAADISIQFAIDYSDGTTVTIRTASQTNDVKALVGGLTISNIFLYVGSSSDQGSRTAKDIVLSHGTTAEAYTPYSGTSLSVEFPASVGTVYGGTVDPVTGEGVVDGIRFVLDGNTNKWALPATWYSYDAGQGYDTFGAYWYFNSTYKGFSDLPLPKGYPTTSETLGKLFSDKLKLQVYGIYARDEGFVWTINVGNAPYFGVRLPKSALNDYSSSSALAQSVMEYFQQNPTEFYYHIATPIPFTLTPQSLTPPAGDAYIWADCGSTAEVTYIGKA